MFKPKITMWNFLQYDPELKPQPGDVWHYIDDKEHNVYLYIINNNEPTLEGDGYCYSYIVDNKVVNDRAKSEPRHLDSVIFTGALIKIEDENIIAKVLLLI